MTTAARPDFFVIGAGRSGTTSMHHYLSQHPQFFMAPKNTSYFYACDLGGSPYEANPGRLPAYFIRDAERYRKLFSNVPPGTLAGDVSPVYLASTRTAARIARHHPSARLIALLRNPVERVFSRYLARHRDGLEHAATFEDLIERDLRDPVLRDDAHATYLAGGMMSQYLETYFDVFPRSQIAVYFYEDFASDTLGVMKATCRFLGVREDLHFDVSRIHNRGGGRLKNTTLGRVWAASEPLRRVLRPLMPRSMREEAFRRITAKTERLTIRPETRKRLQDIYRKDVERLQTLTGRDLSAWVS